MTDKPLYRILPLLAAAVPPPAPLTESRMKRDLMEVKGFSTKDWKRRKKRLKLQKQSKRRNRK